MSRRSCSFFSELVNATTKRFYMMVNYPLSRGLGNIAKVYLIKCSQSTCAKLKKCEFCPVGHGRIAHIYTYMYIHIYIYTYTYTHVYTHHICIMHTYYVYSMHIAYVYIKNYILIIAFLAKVKFELKLN